MSKTMSEWELEYIEKEIMRWLDDGKKVYIENGAANDSIVSYTVEEVGIVKNNEVHFTTSACIFPKDLVLSAMDCNVDTEEFNGCLFVKIW